MRLQGRKVVGGVGEGEALVTKSPISGWGGVDPLKGTIIEKRHELEGKSLQGKILVFHSAKGSSGWSVTFHLARLAGTLPNALIVKKITSKSALGAVVAHIPTVTDIVDDPLEIIETGDWVKVHADEGIVEVYKSGK